MKIVIIGPAYPYRGGIAQYTALMSRALMKKHEITNISYSVQYPKVLYPRNTQKDFENRTFEIKGTQFILSTVNPISWVKTAGFIKKKHPDLLVLQWWHPFFAPAYSVLLKLLRRKYKVIFLCHNVLPHEKFPFQSLLTHLTLQNGGAFIVHSSTDERELKRIIMNPVYRRAFHPTYDIFNASGISKEHVRLAINPNLSQTAPVLLFFGFVREYKGLRVLLTALPEIIEQNRDCKLIIAGDFVDNEKEKYMQLMEPFRDNLILIDGYIPDNEVEKYFSACDLVVLPYLTATQSGVTQIAYGFGKPVVVTNVGGLPETVIEGETGYIVPPDNSAALAGAIIKFLNDPNKERYAENIMREAYRYSWDRMVETVEELYEQLRGNGCGGN